MRRAMVFLLLIVFASTQACSLVAVKRPNQAGELDGTCTEDRDMPWWDVIIGSADAAIGLGITISAISGGGSSTGKGLLAALFLGMAAVHGYSSHKGFNWVEECRKVKGLDDSPSGVAQ